MEIENKNDKESVNRIVSRNKEDSKWPKKIIFGITVEKSNFKKAALGVHVFLIICVIGMLLPDNSSEPGGAIIIWIALAPILLIIYPIHFAILCVRYFRERGDMHILDKISFYFIFIVLVVFSILIT
ncbi:MAG: hypothetical protein OEV93_02530 [Candidatus Moranbacteria bacterium]|nr:hypothetical protein [Candidatus Moranbacteria bacterium]